MTEKNDYAPLAVSAETQLNSSKDVSKEKGLSIEVLKQENFLENMNPSEPRQASFGSMKEGDFKLLAYPDGAIEEDKQKEGWIHTILYKGPDGKNYEKKLTSEESKYGWTRFAARSIISALNRQEHFKSLENKDILPAKDKKVAESGFRENTSNSESLRAIFMALKPGEFETLTYPKGDLVKEPGKKGYVHSIIYKTTDGKHMVKQLWGNDYKYGWTESEAKALTAGLQNPEMVENIRTLEN